MSRLDKPADTDRPVLEVIRLRWSPRAFSDRPVSAADLETILAAAQWAASSYNEQEWRFIVATRAEPDEFARALACLVEPNRQWARLAPVLLFAVGRTAFTQTGQPNRVWQYDVGLAAAQLVLQAMALGVYAHQMAGVDLEAVRRTYGIPAPFEPLTAIALGYPGRLDDLPESLREAELAPRQRRPLSQTVFAGRWGAGWPRG